MPEPEDKDKKKAHEFDVEIFSVGTWNGDKYTVADLDGMVADFVTLKDEFKPPLKLGHNDKQQVADGEPALGWVTALKRSGDKLVATVSRMPDVVYRAIKAGRYRRVSAEIYWNLEHAGKTFRRVLSAVALLGADIPAVTNLADLEALMSQSTATGSFDSRRTYSFGTDGNGTIINNHTKQGDAMPMTAEELQAKLDEEKKARETAEAEAKKYSDALDAERKQRAEQKKSADTEALKAFCEEQVTAGKMTPAARDIIITDTGKHGYSADSGFAIRFDAFKAFMEKQAQILDTSEKAHGNGQTGGKDYTNAGDEVDAQAKKYSAEHKVAYSDAVRAVLDADEDLAERYWEETQGEKTGGD